MSNKDAAQNKKTKPKEVSLKRCRLGEFSLDVRVFIV